MELRGIIGRSSQGTSPQVRSAVAYRRAWRRLRLNSCRPPQVNAVGFQVINDRAANIFRRGRQISLCRPVDGET
jgi:hypothetical protein